MCQKEKFWRVLCEALGRPEWIEDPAFATFAARLKNRRRSMQRSTKPCSRKRQTSG